jgi:hypothetical protein
MPAAFEIFSRIPKFGWLEPCSTVIGGERGTWDEQHWIKAALKWMDWIGMHACRGALPHILRPLAFPARDDTTIRTFDFDGPTCLPT